MSELVTREEKKVFIREKLEALQEALSKDNYIQKSPWVVGKEADLFKSIQERDRLLFKLIAIILEELIDL